MDDGSPDRCPQICDEYASCPRIKVIHKENGGLSDARNVGVLSAAGEYIIFVDSDDYVEKNHLSSLWEALIENNAEISCSPPIVEYENSRTTVDALNDRINDKDKYKSFCVSNVQGQEMILRGRPVGTSAWSKLIKREFCLKHPFPKGKVMEELATTFYLLSEANTVAITEMPTYHYVQRMGSILHSTFSLNEIDEYMSLAEKYVINSRSDTMRFAAIARVYLLGRRLGCSVPEDNENDGYRIINRYCKKYFVSCLNDKKMSMREKVRAFMMSTSVFTLKMVINSIKSQEKKIFNC